MALSSITTPPLTANQSSYQKSEANTEQSGQKGLGSSFDTEAKDGNSRNDTVSLNTANRATQSSEPTSQSSDLDLAGAQNLLRKISKATVENSEIVLSAHKNIAHQVAQPLLTD